jgi:hypothetical protein
LVHCEVAYSVYVCVCIYICIHVYTCIHLNDVYLYIYKHRYIHIIHVQYGWRMGVRAWRDVWHHSCPPCTYPGDLKICLILSKYFHRASGTETPFGIGVSMVGKEALSGRFPSPTSPNTTLPQKWTVWGRQALIQLLGSADERCGQVASFLHFPQLSHISMNSQPNLPSF